MQIYLYKDNQQTGPFAFQQIADFAAQGVLSRQDLAWYEGCADWIQLGQIPGLFRAPPPLQAPLPLHNPASDDSLIRRISEYERISGILWIVLGAIQILTILCIIAGVWNIFAGISRVKASKSIADREASIPKMFEENLTMLIVIGAVNLLLGGVIGILFVAFDFYIRDLVLKNTHLFTGISRQPQAATLL